MGINKNVRFYQLVLILKSHISVLNIYSYILIFLISMEKCIFEILI